MSSISTILVELLTQQFDLITTISLVQYYGNTEMELAIKLPLSRVHYTAWTGFLIAWLNSQVFWACLLKGI